MFQYISDIHLEYLTHIPYIKKTANNLFLVGDIGHPGTVLFNTFLKRCSQTYKNVFLVYGNHEYYSVLRGKNKKIETMQERVEHAKNFPSNVYFLNNSHIYFNKYTHEVKYKLTTPSTPSTPSDINNINVNSSQLYDIKSDYIKIIGSTLWSNKGPGANNFKNIFVEQDKLLTFEYQSQLFYDSKYYIINELYKEDIECILLTHYTTHVLCNGLYLDNKDTNHIRELFLKNNLIAAINGHTHSSINLLVPGTTIKLLSNCYGYKTENQEIVKYNENATLVTDDNVSVSFYGLYSVSDINPIEILYKIMSRPNPKYDIGLISESTPFVVTNTTKDNLIVYVNEAFNRLTGYTINDARGRNCRFLQSPNGDIRRGMSREYCDNNLLFNVKTTVFNKQECQFITYNFKKNGVKFVNLITIIPIEINKMSYYVGLQCDISNEIYKFDINRMDKSIIDTNIITDITNNTIMNKINDESTDTESVSFSVSDNLSLFSNDSSNSRKNIRYKHFFDLNPSLLCIVDLNGYFKKVNNTFLNILGYIKSEIYNKPLLEFIHPDFIIHTIKEMEDIQIKKEIIIENKYIKKDGTTITIKWVSRLKGDVIYCVGTEIK